MLRGQAQLEAMRRRGHVPQAVFICFDDRRLRMADDWSEHTPSIAHLEPVGKPSPADLRCIVGLTVFVLGTDAGAVAAMRDACVEARAARVIAMVCAERAPWCSECVEVSDTKGLLSWPQ